jgi:hypothetical protein
MIPDQTTTPSTGFTPLIAGILNDAQTLIAQQLSLFQSEIRHDLGRVKDAAMPFAVGVAVSFLSGFFIFLTAAQFMVWLWPTLPLFAAYGIVGVFLALLGSGLVFAAHNKLAAFTALPEKSLEGLKENIQWTTKT